MSGQAFQKPRPRPAKPPEPEQNGALVACATCAHARAGLQLRCARNPPQVYVNHGVLSATFPPVSADWCCGEWKGKVQA